LRRRRFSSYTPVPGHPDGLGLLVDNGDDERTAASFRAVTGDDRAHAAWRELYATTHEVAQRLWPTVTEPLRPAGEVRALIGERAWHDLVEQPVGRTVAERFGDDTVAGVVLTDALIGTFADVDDPTTPIWPRTAASSTP
jgi:phytoene dehydrogenase-like protein